MRGGGRLRQKSRTRFDLQRFAFTWRREQMTESGIVTEVEPIVIQSVGEFLEELTSMNPNKGNILWYRGHRSTQWKVEPTVWRQYEPWQERNFAHRFRSRAAIRMHGCSTLSLSLGGPSFFVHARARAREAPAAGGWYRSQSGRLPGSIASGRCNTGTSRPRWHPWSSPWLTNCHTDSLWKCSEAQIGVNPIFV